MDNLQHIDDLLKKSASSFEYAEVDANDWLAVEKKLKQRKKRIYALWFFLALVFVSSSILVLNTNTSETIIPISENEISDIDLTNKSNKQNSVASNSETEAPIIESSKPTISQLAPVIPKIQSTAPSARNSIEDVSIESNNDIPLSEKNTDITTTPIEEITYNLDKTETGVIPEIFEEIQNSSGDNENSDAEKNKIASNVDLNKSAGTKKGVKLKGHWEAGFSFTPSISNKRISENSTLAGLIHVNYYDKAAKSENSSFSNSAGINAQYHLQNGLFFATGAFISQRTESVNYDYTIDSVPINNNNEISGYKPQAPVPVKYNGSNSYHFMEIPLNIGYKTSISTNFEIRSQIGMSYLLLFNQKGKKADFNDLSLKDMSDYALNKNNMAANVKVGVYWNRKHFTIGAEPTFGLNLNNLNVEETSAIIVKPYSYGFNISTNYKFIK